MARQGNRHPRLLVDRSISCRHGFILFPIKPFDGFVRSAFGLRIGPTWESSWD